MIADATRGLGTGADSPWVNRRDYVDQWRSDGVMGYPAVDAWINATYSVQLIHHPSHPGIDHLLVRRHDEGLAFPWADLQRIKDRFVGRERWGLEYFPPAADVIDNANLRHLWVMPAGWEPPIQISDEVRC